MNLLDQITVNCRELLKNSSLAEDCRVYIDSRISEEMQEQFMFGYYPNIINLSALTSLIDENELKAAKLLYDYSMQDSVSTRTIYTSYFENHPLIFPFRDLYGNIVGLVGRSLLSDEEREPTSIQKYKNTKFDKSYHVFGLYEAKQTIIENDSVFVVEGQFDVIKARERGINNIVAVGSSSISDYQLSLICRYTNNICILFDNDEAGEKGRFHAKKKFGHLTNIVNTYLPSGYKDVDEFLKENMVSSLTYTVRDIKYSI